MTENKLTPPAVTFLNEAARYFESRPKNGEDGAHWSNVYNSENCRATAKVIEQMLDALRKADQFMTNGVELGYIRLPTAPDSALETPSIVRAAIAKAEGRA